MSEEYHRVLIEVAAGLRQEVGDVESEGVVLGVEGLGGGRRGGEVEGGLWKGAREAVGAVGVKGGDVEVKMEME